MLPGDSGNFPSGEGEEVLHKNEVKFYKSIPVGSSRPISPYPLYIISDSKSNPFMYLKKNMIEMILTSFTKAQKEYSGFFF